jgi:hypothetical protein
MLGDLERMNAQPSIISREITFEWPLDFAKAIRRRHFSRQIRRPCLVFLPIGIFGLIGVWLHSQKGESGGGYWVLICISVAPFVLWGLHHWATSQMRPSGAIPRFTVRVEPESITVKSEKSESTIKWAAIKTMWRFPEMILLFWDKKNQLDHSFALPVASLGEEGSRYIEDRVREHGGVVC